MELLKYLHGKYILCVASNGPYMQQVNRLKISGMLPYFSDLFISEEIGSSKPSEKFFHISGTLFRKDFAAFCKHPFRNMTQFYQIFPVSGIFSGIGF